MGEIWALLILELADKPVLPFQITSYASAIAKYIEDLDTYAKSTTDSKTLNLTPLRNAADTLAQESQRFHAFDTTWRDFVFGSGGFESGAMSTARTEHNDRLAKFESNLLDLREDGGLVNRTQFKHVVFAPQMWSGYDDATFPGVRDAIDVDDWEGAQAWVEIIAQLIEGAAAQLNA
jgi:hypothetical protein